MNREFPNIKLLVVEDEDSKLREWADAIEHHNADSDRHGYLIDIFTSKSVADAKELINGRYFDAVVVDLRLKIQEGVSENNSHGNELVRYLVENQPLGVAVYTGQRAEVDVSGYGVAQVAVMDKGDGLGQVFDWLSENIDLFVHLRAAKELLNRETARMFFGSVWPRWKHWTGSNQGSNSDGLVSAVARHMVAHMHDSLLIASGEMAHPEESYFVPPLKQRLDTGDMLDYQGRTWVVVTPRCDLANKGKIKTVLLAACEDVSEIWVEKLQLADKERAKQIGRMVQHDGSPKQHFLFEMQLNDGKKRGPWFVQFHDISAVPVEQALEQLAEVRFASISPLFVPSLVERFGAYFSRIGTPSFAS